MVGYTSMNRTINYMKLFAEHKKSIRKISKTSKVKKHHRNRQKHKTYLRLMVTASIKPFKINFEDIVPNKKNYIQILKSTNWVSFPNGKSVYFGNTVTDWVMEFNRLNGNKLVYHDFMFRIYEGKQHYKLWYVSEFKNYDTYGPLRLKE